MAIEYGAVTAALFGKNADKEKQKAVLTAEKKTGQTMTSKLATVTPSVTVKTPSAPVLKPTSYSSKFGNEKSRENRIKEINTELGILNTQLSSPDFGITDLKEMREANKRKESLELELKTLKAEKKFLNDKNERTGKVGDWVDRVESNLDIGRLSENESAAWDAYLTNPTKANREYAENLGKIREAYEQNNKEILKEKGWLSTSVAGYLPQFWNQLGAQATGAAAGAAAGSLVGPAGVIKGAKAGAVAATGAHSFKTMRGAAFKALLNEGVSEDIARKAASDEAVVSALIEMADTGLDIATFGRFSAVKAALGQKAVSAAGKTAIGKVASALAPYVGNILGEAAEEAAQEAVSIKNIERAKGGKTGAWELAKEAPAVVMDEEGRKQMAQAAWEGAKIAAVGAGLDAVHAGGRKVVEDRVVSNEGDKVRSAGESDQLVADALTYFTDESESYKTALKWRQEINAGKRSDYTSLEIGQLNRMMQQDRKDGKILESKKAELAKRTEERTKTQQLQDMAENAQSPEEQQYAAAQLEHTEATVVSPVAQEIMAEGIEPGVAVDQAELIRKISNGEQLTNKEIKGLKLTNPAVKAAFTEATGVEVTDADARSSSAARKIIRSASEVMAQQKATEAAVKAQEQIDAEQQQAEMQQAVANPSPAAKEVATNRLNDAIAAEEQSRAAVASETPVQQNSRLGAAFNDIAAMNSADPDAMDIYQPGTGAASSNDKTVRHSVEKKQKTGKKKKPIGSKAEVDEQHKRVTESESESQPQSQPQSQEAKQETGLRELTPKGSTRITLDRLNSFAKKRGLTVKYGDLGKDSGSNAFYDKSSKTIWLNHKKATDQRSMTRYFAHELTHATKDTDSKLILNDLYEVAKDIKTAKTVHELVQERLNTYRAFYLGQGEVGKAEAFTEMDAREEVMADFIMEAIGDVKVLDKLTGNKPKLTMRMLDHLQLMISKGRRDGVDVRALEKLAGRMQKSLTDAQLKAVGVHIDPATESVSPERFSLNTWKTSDYIEARDVAAAELAKALDISEQKARDYIDDVNGIARMIAEEQSRLDYVSIPGKSSFVGNVEYGGSFDFSTLCKKRRLLTGTFTAIQKALPNTALTADEILEIRNMMIEKDLEVSCGLCYVEGSRASMGGFAQSFIELYESYYPDRWIPDMTHVNTPDGVEWMRINHPECFEQYEYFWNHYGTLRDGDKKLFASQQKPKLYQLHTEYKGEILKHFKKDSSVEAKNQNGGIRLQSFSDFEIVHLLDTMQVIMDMARVGLNGQAYTKVPDFAWALGDTGLKINLSLIAKGVDENGKLIFDEREGMKFADAMALRERYSENVGTVIVAFNDDQLLAALADDRIDYVLPFHRSQWKKKQYGAMGLPAKTKDYTYIQNEKLVKQTYHEYRGRMVKDKATNYMPNAYWDFSRTGKENAEAYLRMCAANNKRPKSYKLLVDNKDGSYSLRPDGSTDGYWKLLIDFKMYDNEGNGSPQRPVRPDFNLEECRRMLNTYEGGHSNFPVAHGIVDEFVSKYKEHNPGKRYSLPNEDSDGKKLTPEQQEFFKDSKVRDEQGRLTPVYHGTPAGGFTEFKLPEYLSVLMSARGAGFYFTDKKNASQYTKPLNGKTSGKKQLYKVYLNITNPLVIAEDSPVSITKEQFKEIIRRGNYDWFRTNGLPHQLRGDTATNKTLPFEEQLDKWTDQIFRGALYDEDILNETVRAYKGGTPEILENMKDILGYDGVRYTDKHGDIWVAWSSNQIKNTTNKNPTSDPDIRYSLPRIDKSNMSEEGKKIVGSLVLDAFSARTTPGKYASMTPERFKKEYFDSIAKGSPDYAQKYITWVDPMDFVYATTTSEAGRDALRAEAGDLDIERLQSHDSAMWLSVNMETGEIIGHEGRHRMLALHKAGVEKVAVIIRFVNADRNNAQPIDYMRLKGQEFLQNEYGYTPHGDDFSLHGVLPLSERYGKAALQLFCTPEKEGLIRYSLNSESESSRMKTDNNMEESSNDQIERSGYAGHPAHHVGTSRRTGETGPQAGRIAAAEYRFAQEAARAGQTYKKGTGEHSVGIRYQEVADADQSPAAKEALKHFKYFGLNAFVYDEEFEILVGEKIISSRDDENDGAKIGAATIDRADFAISNRTTLNGGEIAAHETFHLHHASATGAAFTDALEYNLDLESEAFIALNRKITKDYFKGVAPNINRKDPSPETALFWEELSADVAGKIYAGIQDPTMFDDFNAVKKAWGDFEEAHAKKNSDTRYSLDPATGYEEGSVQDRLLKLLDTADFESAVEELNRWAHEIRTGNISAMPEEAGFISAVLSGRPLTPAEAAQNRIVLNAMIKQSGLMDAGENPARTVLLPNESLEGHKTSKYVRTVAEAPVTLDWMVDEIERGVGTGEAGFTYEVVTDKAAMKYVEECKRRQPHVNFAIWDEMIRKGKGSGIGGTFSKKDIAFGEYLYTQAVADRDAVTATKLVAEIAAIGTQAGQTVQAMRLLKKMSPAGQLYYVQKAVENLNRKLKERGHTDLLYIDIGLAEDVLNAKTQEEIDAAVEKLIGNIAEQAPVTLMDKWDTWRYLSMLGNPRTHIRNIVSNAVFAPVTFLKDLVATGIESKVIKDPAQRTKALGWKKYDEFAEADFKQVEATITGTGKQNISDQIRDRRQIFKSKPGKVINKLSDKNSEWMNKEDSWFLKPAYKRALGQFLAAHNADIDALTNTAPGRALLEQARDYAIAEAQKATFRDASVLASAISQFENHDLATKFIVGSLAPFKKTPINLLKRGVEYSPVGLLDTLTRRSKQLRNGEITTSEYIDHISAGLTGTSIMALGWGMTAMGLLRGGGSDDDKEDAFDELQGAQTYSIVLGDMSFTIDWMAPAALPLFIGYEAYNRFTEKGLKALTGAELIDTMMNLANPMFQLSMLDGLNSTFRAARYGDNPVYEIGTNMLTSYVSQGVPTIAGQVARTIDGTRRSAYVEKGTSAPFISRFAQNTAAKTPGLSKNLTPRLDAWGRTDTEGRVWLRALENFILPGYVSFANTSPMETELDRLYKVTGNSSVLPKSMSKYFNVDKVRYDLSADEWETYQTVAGQTSYRMLSDLVNSPAYRSLTDAQKADAVEDIFTYAKEKGKSAAVPSYTDAPSWIGKADDMSKRGFSVDEYVVQRIYANGTDVGSTQDVLSMSWLSDTDRANLISDSYGKKLTKNTFSDPNRSGYIYSLTEAQVEQYEQYFETQWQAEYVQLTGSTRYLNADIETRAKMIDDLKGAVADGTKKWMARQLRSDGARSTKKD